VPAGRGVVAGEDVQVGDQRVDAGAGERGDREHGNAIRPERTRGGGRASFANRLRAAFRARARGRHREVDLVAQQP
jgi:hypothetical protein